MAGSDTIVGIVGALVLVAVMAGVFVYEYNNPPASGGSGNPDDDARARFASMYPTLDADQDIDGDDIRNLNDTDIDGDGTNELDANGVPVDTQISVELDVSLNFPQRIVIAGQCPQGTCVQTFPFSIGNGSTEAEIALTFTQDAAGFPTFSGEVTGPEPIDVNTSGTSLTGTGAAPPPGSYTLMVTQTQSSTSAHAVSGTITIHYGEHQHPM